MTSGICLGTPAGTTRSFGVAEYELIADLIIRMLSGLAKNGADANAQVERSVLDEVEALCRRFPVYPTLCAS